MAGRNLEARVLAVPKNADSEPGSSPALAPAIFVRSRCHTSPAQHDVPVDGALDTSKRREKSG
jgi:hypothetical protein